MEDDINTSVRNAFVFLFQWSKDACEQGTGNSVDDPGWHNFVSTWEEYDEMLPYLQGVMDELMGLNEDE